MAAKKKMSMKQALMKYEASAEDKRKDKAGAKKLLKADAKRPMGSKRGY